MKKLISAALIAAGIFAVGCNDEKTTATTTNDSLTNTAVADQTAVVQDTAAVATTAGNDAGFAMEAAQGGMAEVKSGQLAQKNGTAAIKDLADMMVKDHSAANEELKSLATKINITLPTTINEMQQKKYDELAAKKGADFDKAYVAAMVEDHEMDINKFKQEASGGSNADLKAWASGKLPTLTHHLEMTNSTKAKLK